MNKKAVSPSTRLRSDDATMALDAAAEPEVLEADEAELVVDPDPDEDTEPDTKPDDPEFDS
jgi:hypothetical protein